MKYNYHRRLILIGWLFFALAVIYISVCMWLPTFLQLPLLMLSSIFTVPLTMEFNIRGMILQVLCITVVCVFQYGIAIVAPYVLFLGYYPPVKFLFEQHGGMPGFLGKLMVYFFAFGITIRLFPSSLFTAYAFLPWFLFVPVLFAFFVAMDIAVSMFAAFYNSSIRRRLL